MGATVLCMTPAEVLQGAATGTSSSVSAERYDLQHLAMRSQDFLRRAMPDADIVIGDWTGHLHLGPTELELAKRCVAVLQPTAGYNCIDAAGAAKLGIAVANTPGANTRAVAEWVVMATLAMLKGAPRADEEVRRGIWRMVEASRDGVYEMADRTIGIIGFGDIGRAVAKRVSAFDPAAILYYDPVEAPPKVAHELHLHRAAIDELFERSDVVTLHVPLVDATRGLVSKHRLELLGPGGILVNTARGGVVDSDALEEALGAGAIRAAALDVFESEPLQPGHRWSRMRNVLLSPHLAGSTNESRARMIGDCFSNVDTVVRQQLPRHVVNGITQLRSPRW